MTRDMTTGSPLARILAFCAPLLVGNLFQQFYNLADSILVGRLLGVRAFAAVGATGALSFLILGFALGICSGFAIPIAQSFGAGDMDTVRSRTGQTVWLGLFFSALITAVTYFGTDEILHLMRTPDEIYDDAYRYIFIVFMGTGFTILYNLASGVLRALGDSRTPLYFLMGAVTVNVLLDLLFMGGWGMGVEGAAYATILSQAASGLACLLYIRRKVPLLRLTRRDLRPSLRRMGTIAAIGVPMGLQFSITAVGSILLQSAVNGLGADAVAAVSAGAKVHNIVAAPLESCGVAMATYCGQNLGAGRVDRIRQGLRAMVVLTFLYCGFGFLVNAFAGSDIAWLFVDASETAILVNVRRYLVTMSSFYPLLALVFLLRNGLQGMGFSQQAMLAGLSELVARAAMAFGFVGRFGFRAVCFANPAAWLAADLILLALYRLEIRKLDTEPELLLRLMHAAAAPKLKHAAAK
ncbi:MAG: MATE family efflux transporter [Oscillospiraceae bacterium]|nr:MATE family efflux transporter [Oscillospiraceae bacterium]